MFRHLSIGALALQLALTVNAPTATAEELSLVQAVFPEFGRPCRPLSPTVEGNGFDVKGPGTLVIQDWALPIMMNVAGGAKIVVRSAGDRLLGGFFTNSTIYDFRSPPSWTSGMRTYLEYHYKVSEEQNIKDVVTRIEPYSFSIDCKQYASARRIQISFYGTGVDAPRASEDDIDIIFSEMTGEPRTTDDSATEATDTTKPATPNPTSPGLQEPFVQPYPEDVQPHGPVQKHQLGNSHTVQNGPSQPTKIQFNKPFYLLKLQTYHWNHGKGTPEAGLITLVDPNGALAGQWQAEGLPGMNNVPNANWVVYPNRAYAAGTYTVLVSSPETWSTNAEAYNRGFIWIEVQDVETK